MKAIYKNLEISAVFLRSQSQAEAFDEKSRNGLHSNTFKITVLNTDNSNEIDFLYHGSHADYKAGKKELNESDLLQAFECFLSDAIAGDMDFEDFCNEFGYDEDSRRAERIHNACQEHKELFESLEIDNDLYDFSNEFREAHENII